MLVMPSEAWFTKRRAYTINSAFYFRTFANIYILQKTGSV